MSDSDPGDRAMFWFNLIGISVATMLLGSFFWFFGVDFLGLMILLFGSRDDWPDH